MSVLSKGILKYGFCWNRKIICLRFIYKSTNLQTIVLRKPNNRLGKSADTDFKLLRILKQCFLWNELNISQIWNRGVEIRGLFCWFRVFPESEGFWTNRRVLFDDSSEARHWVYVTLIGLYWICETLLFFQDLAEVQQGYMARTEEELTISTGDTVEILDRNETQDWSLVQKQVPAAKSPTGTTVVSGSEKKGWVPSNYLNSIQA